MNHLTLTLGQLVDSALDELQSPAESGLLLSLGTAIDASVKTLTLSDATNVNVSDLLEIGSELLLVTAKTSDPVPVLTVSRGYYGSTAAAASLDDPVTVNPPHSRIRVAEAIKRSFARLEALGIPLLASATFSRAVGYRYVEMPEATRDVLRVSYVAPTGQWFDLPNWEFIGDAPTSKFASGKIVKIPRYVYDDDELEIVYRLPYRWSTHPAEPTESDSIVIPEGAETLPALYAAAWLVSRREISRQQLDRAEEWNAGEPSRGGVSLSLVRALWQEFYRMLDEARRLAVVPVHRPYRRMRHF